MTGPCLVVRADAGADTGAGHVMRCLALAQAWKGQGGHACFVMARHSHSVEARLKLESFDVVRIKAKPGGKQDALETIRVARNWRAPWVAVDGYGLDASYQRLIKGSHSRVLVIDDIGGVSRYFADIVLNHTIHAHQGMYEKREPSTRLLLGTRYALLRREFRQWREWQRNVPPRASKVLVTMGGSDTSEATLHAIEALRRLRREDLQVRVVIGALNQRRNKSQEVAGRAGFTILRDVRDMAPLMAWADMAIAAAGTTTWELAYMQVPSVLVVAAENQRRIAEEMGRSGIAVHVNASPPMLVDALVTAISPLLSNRARRTAMARMGRKLVDGRGADRVLMHLTGRLLRGKAVKREGSKTAALPVKKPDAPHHSSPTAARGEGLTKKENTDLSSESSDGTGRCCERE